jgi:hypothetical protein
VLVQAVLAGDASGFKPLVTRRRDRVFRFLVKRVDNPREIGTILRRTVRFLFY